MLIASNSIANPWEPGEIAYTDFNQPPCDDICKRFYRFEPITNPFHEYDSERYDRSMKRMARVEAVKMAFRLFVNPIDHKKINSEYYKKPNKFDDWSLNLRASSSGMRLQLEYRF